MSKSDAILAAKYLSPEELETVEAIFRETGIRTVQDSVPGFRWDFGPWIKADDVVPGNTFHMRLPHDPQTQAWEKPQDKPNPNLRRRRDIEYVAAVGFPSGVPIGCFRVESRAMQNVEKWDFVDTVYDIHPDIKKQLRAYLEGRRWVTQDEARKIEVERERARARAADAALDPGAAARETGKAMAEAFVAATRIAAGVAEESPAVAPAKRGPGRPPKASVPEPETVA